MENNNQNKQDNLIDKIFFKKYRIVEKIGQGAFGFIYKGEYNNKYYALKLENINNEKKILENEASIMIYLKGPNIPYIKTYGACGQFNILVMQLLGKDLQTLFIENGPFSIKTACLLAYQMISILEYIHNKDIIHRDIKPENFLLGLEENSKLLYLIDFGLSKKYNKKATTHFTPNKEGKKMTGTPRYASINALRGLEQSPRDDLESVGYVLIYLLKGSLPWQGIKIKSKIERIKSVLVKKIETSSTDLCSDLPNEFEKYIDYCKDLEINVEPDYNMLKNLFLEVLNKEKLKFDYIYDWINPHNKKYYNYNKNNNNNNTNKYNNNLNTEDRPIIVKNNNNNIFEKELNENKDSEKEEEEEEKAEENKPKEQPVCCCTIY